MPAEILTPREMGEVDRRAIERGPHDGAALMRNAGAAVAAAVLARHPGAARIHILCGPGNNGGDGYVAARRLVEAGCAVSLWSAAAPPGESDAARAAAQCPVKAAPLAEFEPDADSLVVDALFGAGLSRPVEGAVARAIGRCAEINATVVAVDLPSGVSGETGQVLGSAFRATTTVTFVRRKPGHLLYPGRQLCGEVVVADIGIGDAIVAEAGCACFENDPTLWRSLLPVPVAETHKYRRGHVGVLSGGPTATGAARLSAMAAARAGAGAVTLLSPGNALAVNAMHLTAIMLRKADDAEEVRSFLEERKPGALVLGPGLPASGGTAALAIDLLAHFDNASPALVLDASALTAFAGQPEILFDAATRPELPPIVLTPHHGEFGRLFAEIALDDERSKLEKARAAARRAGATVIYKGPDTVIAAPDGRAAINTNGTPLLATAGSGDVLSGIVASLLAQGMPAFEAACAAVWMHAEAALRFGPGLIAEDLPGVLPSVARDLH